MGEMGKGVKNYKHKIDKSRVCNVIMYVIIPQFFKKTIESQCNLIKTI